MTPAKPPLLVRRTGDPTALSVLRAYEDWGLLSLDLVGPPRRLWADGETPTLPIVDMGVDEKRVEAVPSPGDLLLSGPGAESWSAQTRRSLARLRALFLITEDPQRRLDARQVNTLAHQVSLIQHIKESPSLKRVMIADEVGLGKTVEAGLLIQELLAKDPRLHVLYLAPARLVKNVRRELDRLGLEFRQWTATDGDAKLENDRKIVASIHRAVHGANSDAFSKSGPWDVLIVDECHHLNDWEPGGGNPRENFRLVREIIRRLDAEARVIFMSGTPHQGHEARFQNLLRLLCRTDESDEHLAGRVIYRTKDDVSDWEGKPLFPSRQVNTPLLFSASPAYLGWLRRIHEFYMPGEIADDDAGRRAAGWRCAQALQWAASSPQAGVGYLVRQAVRAGWKPGTRNLTDALAVLRPYRFGSPSEPIHDLFDRIKKAVGLQNQTIEPDEDDDETAGPFRDTDSAGLAALLRTGLDVLAEAGDSKWDLLREKVLNPAGDERVVLFAQPIETVTAVASYLERTSGEKPAVIIGGQTDEVRQDQIDRFCRPGDPRFLISSRAGGEGINLQVSRRLVHIDVPWNPMEMEQRVGRVHRFGSRETIIVDTMVMRASREEEMYAAANRKLRLIASTMVEPERVDALFARVMALIPPEDLQAILLRHTPGQEAVDVESIGHLVQAGFNKWRRFHETYSVEQRKIRDLDPGLASWDDVDEFLCEYAEARPLAGYFVQRFDRIDGEVRPVTAEARVITLDGNSAYASGDYAGTPVYALGKPQAGQLGLNVGPVAEALRKAAFQTMPTGAAQLRWPGSVPPPASFPFGAVVLLRQTLRAEKASWTEGPLSLHCFTVSVDGAQQSVDGPARGALLRGLFKGTVRTKPEEAPGLISKLQQSERDLVDELRRPTPEQQEQGIRFSVTPILAAVVGSPPTG